MNPQIDEDKIIADALVEEQKLARKAQYDMMRMGVRDTADKLADPRAQEMLGKSALARAIMRNVPVEQPKGPARRKPPKVDKRKQQRQARRRSR